MRLRKVAESRLRNIVVAGLLCKLRVV
jgi:hypothetical protein